MQSILNRTAMANDVAPQFLEYIGTQDERCTVGKVLLHFTITDPTHRRYKSTVAHTVVLKSRYPQRVEYAKGIDRIGDYPDTPLQKRRFNPPEPKVPK